jgi:molecular chaperone GrpE (heat shock protein)
MKIIGRDYVRRSFYTGLLLGCFVINSVVLAEVIVPGKTLKPIGQQTSTTPPKNKSTTTPDQATSGNQQQFSSSLSEMLAKAEVFVNNAESFKKMLEKVSPEKIQDNQEQLKSIIDSMKQNAGDLQNLAKRQGEQASDEQLKNFYTRELLPNLQNIYRQLSRIEASAEGQINHKNMVWQANRVQESIQQVVDRIKKYEAQSNS